jgi:O-antigen/teichoic acid export membrane protein
MNQIPIQKKTNWIKPFKKSEFLNNLIYFGLAVGFVKGGQYLFKLILVIFLDPLEYGLYTELITIRNLLMAISVWGLVATLVKEIAYFRGKKNYERVFQTIASGLYYLISMCLITGLILYFFNEQLAILFLGDIEISPYLMFIIPLLILGSFSRFFEGILKGFNNFKFVLIKNFIEQASRLLLVILMFFLFTRDFYIPILAWTAGLIISVITSLFLFFKLSEINSKIKLPNIKLKDIRSFIYISLLIGGLNLGETLMHSIDVFSLKHFLNSDIIVGNYGFAVAMASILSTFPMVLGNVLFPRVSEKRAKNKKVNTDKVFFYTLIITFVLFGVLWVFATEIIFLINDKYTLSPTFMKYLLFGSIAYGIYIISFSFIVTERRYKLIAFYVGISAIINLILNILLIHLYGAYGASWATSISYILLAILIYIHLIKIGDAFDKKILLIFIIEILFIISISEIIDYLSLNIIIKIIIGSFCIFIGAFVWFKKFKNSY